MPHYMTFIFFGLISCIVGTNIIKKNGFALEPAAEYMYLTIKGYNDNMNQHLASKLREIAPF